VQNGLGGLIEAHRLAPASPLLGGLALFAASYLEPGHVTITGANPMIVGAAPGTDRAVLDRIAAVLHDALPIEVTDDIEGAQWTKLLINHVNALPAITGMSVQQVVADRRLRRIMTASMRETVRIARRAGVRFARVQGVSGRVLELVGVLPLALGAFFPRLLARRMGSVPNPGSTLQSIRRGQLTEIDYLNGAVVRVAEDLGLPTPINAAIVALVHEVEGTGRFIAAEDVATRVVLR
jgi:2-dehydropantoate 2-reductase